MGMQPLSVLKIFLLYQFCAMELKSMSLSYNLGQKLLTLEITLPLSTHYWQSFQNNLIPSLLNQYQHSLAMLALYHDWFKG